MFDFTDPYNYTILGMYQESFEDEVDSLYRKSLSNPVPRREVEDLLARYNISYGDVPSWIRWKLGDVEVID